MDKTVTASILILRKGELPMYILVLIILIALLAFTVFSYMSSGH